MKVQYWDSPFCLDNIQNLKSKFLLYKTSDSQEPIPRFLNQITTKIQKIK
jgi:hypothetical protein